MFGENITLASRIPYLYDEAHERIKRWADPEDDTIIGRQFVYAMNANGKVREQFFRNLTAKDMLTHPKLVD